MGRVAVRSAIQQYIAGLLVPYVGTVFSARPVILKEDAYVTAMNGMAVEQSANGSACVIVVNIPSDQRNRLTLTGRQSVDDMMIHKIALELFFASIGDNGEAAQNDYDSIVDALIIAIRANPIPGPTGVIWSAGEYRAGVSHNQVEPYQADDGMTIFINGAIRYEAWEQDVGTDV